MHCNENLSVCLPTAVLDREPLITADGDKTVVSPSAVYMGGIGTFYIDLNTYNAEFVDRSHASILEATPTQEVVQNIILGDVSVLPLFTSIEKPVTKENLRIRVHSPISLDVTDGSGKRTGTTEVPGSDFKYVEESIPNSSYMEFGEGKYIFLDGDGEYIIDLHGLATGTFTLGIDTIVDDVVVGTVEYENIPVTEYTVGSLVVHGTASTSPLVLDVDGDGTSDSILSVGEVGPLEYIELIEEVVGQMDIAKNKEKKIEKRLDDIEDAIEKKEECTKKCDIPKLVKNIADEIDDFLNTIRKLNKKGHISHEDAQILVQMIENLRLLVIQ
ncbi:MAG: Uncharacterized protein Greene101415_909 [Parcubacteria group bacterium Greene1014_15]|nr:MAG: Uncharacterized protein Greene101415_909 [Parcubacteria group bacterium Greene1014_15]